MGDVRSTMGKQVHKYNWFKGCCKSIYKIIIVIVMDICKDFQRLLWWWCC